MSPEEMARRQYVFSVLRDAFSRYGFSQIETPSFENLSTLMGKYGEEGDRLIFKILNSGDYLEKAPGELLSQRDSLHLTRHISEKALRYDLTVPFARYVVQHQGEITFPFKRFQMQPVWRADRPQKGRFREFYQCDADVVGSKSLWQEVELVQLYDEVFSSLGIPVSVRINNRKILSGLAEVTGQPELIVDMTVALDKLDKIGAEKVKELLMEEEIGLTEEQAGEILTFIAITGSNEAVLSALEGYRGRNEIFDQGLDELNTVVKYLAAFGVPQTHFAVDLTIARGLDYYTGTVYETTMLDHPEIGSICSGGRYDNLAEYYTDKQLPGVGISIGLTRLFFVLEDQGYLNDALNTAPADVLILPMTDDLSPAIALATTLRQAGIRTQIHAEQKKFKQKISYADKLSIPYAVFLGEDEISSGVCAVKDLQSGEQVKLSPAEAVSHIQAGLDKLNQGKPILDKGE